MGMSMFPMRPQTFRVSRFPGWKIHVQQSIYSGDVVMVAIRESDGKRLEYSEPEPRNLGEHHAVMSRLAARLGEDFLDLVPLETPPR